MELRKVNQLIVANLKNSDDEEISELEYGVDVLDLKDTEEFKVITKNLKLSSKFASNANLLLQCLMAL